MSGWWCVGVALCSVCSCGVSCLGQERASTCPQERAYCGSRASEAVHAAPDVGVQLGVESSASGVPYICELRSAHGCEDDRLESVS